MPVLYANNAASRLSASITNTATSFSVTSGTGALFPAITGSDVFYATLMDTAGNLEIVRVTARAADTFTVVRGQDGTTARAFSANDMVELRITKAMLDDLKGERLALTGGTVSGVLSLPQNPVGTTYGSGVSANPPYRIEQGAGDNDGWRLYGESASSNTVRMVFEVIDDIETAGYEWLFRNRKTYGDYAATEPFRISGEGQAWLGGNQVLHAGNFGSYALPLGGGNLTGLTSVSGGAFDGTYTSSRIRFADGGMQGMKLVEGGVFEAVRAMNASTTAGTTVRLVAAASSDPFNNTNGGKVFIDAVRTASNMDLVFSLNDVSGAAPVERFRFTGGGAGIFTGTAPTLLELHRPGSSANANMRFSNSASTTFFGIGAQSGELRVGSTVDIYNTGNVVLHSGNFGSYAFKAEGTTNDNIDADRGQGVVTFDPVPSGTPPAANPNIRTLSIGNDFNRRTQLAFIYDNDRAWFRRRTEAGWGAWREFLHSGNFTSYSPSLTGSGASGTWGINITGNAATVSTVSSGQLSPVVGYTTPTDASGYTWIRFAFASGDSFNAGQQQIEFYVTRSITENGGNPYGGCTAKFTAQGREWHSGQEMMVVQYGEHGSNASAGAGFYITNARVADFAGGGYWVYLRVRSGIRYYFREALHGGAGCDFSTLQGTTDPGSGQPIFAGLNLISTGGDVNFYDNGNAVLHAGNVGTYALPIGGGTMSGSILGGAGVSTLIRGQFNGVDRGQLYNDNSGMGLLSGAGSWALRVNDGTVNVNAFGAFNAAGAITQNGNQVLHAGNFSSYALPLSGGTLAGGLQVGYGGGDLTIRATAANDLGDLVWANYSGTEIHRLWDGGDGLNYRYNGGTAYKLLHAGNFSSYAPSIGGGSTIGGITYFSNSESMQVFGIRGRFSGGSDGQGIHLFSNVDIGYPTGWGSGLGSTPSRGLSTYGAIRANYGAEGTCIYMGAGSVTTSNALRINFHTDSDLNYYIGKRAGAWTQPLDVAFYTGIRYHAHLAYGGHKFYIGARDENLAMSVGDGDGNVRVFSSLLIGSSGHTALHAGNYTGYALPLGGGTLTGLTKIKAGHGDTRLQLHYNHDNNDNSGFAGYLTLWASEPGISYAYSGIGGNINSGGQWYGRQSSGQPYGLYMRFDVGSGQTQFWSTTGSPGGTGGQGSITFVIDAAGNITATGNVAANSDERLKTDWAPVAANFIERLAAVKSGTYTRIDGGARQAGSSAQDWQQLLPEVVQAANDEQGTLSLAYGNAALVSAIELAKDNIELRARIERLESLIATLIGDQK